MMLRKLFPVVIAMAFLAVVAQSPHVYVYRNDSTFTGILRGGDVVLTHMADSTGLYKLQTPAGEQIPVEVIDSCVVRTTDIPTLYLSLTDYPDITMLWDKELYLDAEISIQGNGYIDDLEPTALKVKGRGNSSWSFVKKPMRLKFGKKTSIGTLRKAKNYVLLANYVDPTLMKNTLMMWLANKLSMPYANHAVPCNVVLNGTDIGSYLLTEKVGINSGSVDIDETAGILFELSSEFDEPYKFRSAKLNLPVMVKDPDFDELEQDGQMTAVDRLAMWQDDWNAAESAVYSGKGFDYFDLDAFVDYILVNNILANDEIWWPKSMYIYKTAPGEECKYMFGPTWDFDAAANRYTRSDYGVIIERGYYTPLGVCNLLSRLINYKEFKEAYAARFAYFRESVYDEMLAFFDSYAWLVEPSAKLNGVIWSEKQDLSWVYYTNTFDTTYHTERLRQWLVKRVEYLQGRVDKGLVL